MASIHEIMQLCRLCLVKEQVNTPIFEEVDDISQTFLKISTCLPVKVSRDDTLPKNICDSCSYKLELFYEFWNTSANSEKQLTKWLSQLGVNKSPSSKAINTLAPSSQGLNVNPMILKQEVPELVDPHTVDNLVPSEDLNVCSDAQDYVLQQPQQLPYEAVEFEFQQESFMDSQTTANVASTANLSKEGTTALNRKRHAAVLDSLSGTLEDSEDEDVGLVGPKITKTEGDIEDENDEIGNDITPTSFVDLPSTSGDNDQPGPSGVGKTAADAPFWNRLNFPIKQEQPERVVNSKNGLWICKICDQSFANNADVIDHVYSAILEMYICCRCGSKFVDEKTFRLHLRDHKRQSLQLSYSEESASPSGKIIDSRVNNMFICKYCDAPFKDRVLFYNHYISHTTGRKNRQLAVKRCTENKLSEIGYDITHNFKVEKLYYGIKYRCKKCQMAFYNLDRNATHADKCVGLLKSCDLCRSIFETNLKLFEHYDTVHSDCRKMCKYCFETFSEDSLLIHHIIKLHLKFSHYCYDCNEGFVSPYKFSAHLRRHSTKS